MATIVLACTDAVTHAVVGQQAGYGRKGKGCGCFGMQRGPARRSYCQWRRRWRAARGTPWRTPSWQRPSSEVSKRITHTLTGLQVTLSDANVASLATTVLPSGTPPGAHSKQAGVTFIASGCAVNTLVERCLWLRLTLFPPLQGWSRRSWLTRSRRRVRACGGASAGGAWRPAGGSGWQASSAATLQQQRSRPAARQRVRPQWCGWARRAAASSAASPSGTASGECAAHADTSGQCSSACTLSALQGTTTGPTWAGFLGRWREWETERR